MTRPVSAMIASATDPGGLLPNSFRPIRRSQNPSRARHRRRDRAQRPGFGAARPPGGCGRDDAEVRRHRSRGGPTGSTGRPRHPTRRLCGDGGSAPGLPADGRLLPLALVGDSVYEYEKTHLPDGAWPPKTWYADWVSGLDVFEAERETSPIEMRWL